MKRHKLAMETLDSRELLTSLLGGDAAYPTIPDMPGEGDLIVIRGSGFDPVQNAVEPAVGNHYIPPNPQPWDADAVADDIVTFGELTDLHS